MVGEKSAGELSDLNSATLHLLFLWPMKSSGRESRLSIQINNHLTINVASSLKAKKGTFKLYTVFKWAGVYSISAKMERYPYLLDYYIECLYTV